MSTTISHASSATFDARLAHREIILNKVATRLVALLKLSSEDPLLASARRFQALIDGCDLASIAVEQEVLTLHTDRFTNIVPERSFTFPEDTPVDFKAAVEACQKILPDLLPMFENEETLVLQIESGLRRSTSIDLCEKDGIYVLKVHKEALYDKWQLPDGSFSAVAGPEFSVEINEQQAINFVSHMLKDSRIFYGSVYGSKYYTVEDNGDLKSIGIISIPSVWCC